MDASFLQMRAPLLFKEKISNITRNAFIFGFTHCPPAEQNVVIFVLELILCVTIQQILIGLETVSLGVIFPE